MKITVEKHAYAIIDIDLDRLSPELRKQLENASENDDNIDDLCERIVEEQEADIYWEDYQDYESVVQLENNHGTVWRTIGI